MAHDPKLLEAVKNAPVEIDGYDRLFTVRELLEYGFDRHTDSRAQSQIVLARALKAALDAIDASVDENGNRIAWVAPWSPPATIAREGERWSWRYARDAYLAERRGDAG